MTLTYYIPTDIPTGTVYTPYVDPDQIIIDLLTQILEELKKANTK